MAVKIIVLSCLVCFSVALHAKGVYIKKKCEKTYQTKQCGKGCLIYGKSEKFPKNYTTYEFKYKKNSILRERTYFNFGRDGLNKYPPDVESYLLKKCNIFNNSNWECEDCYENFTWGSSCTFHTMSNGICTTKVWLSLPGNNEKTWMNQDIDPYVCSVIQ